MFGVVTTEGPILVGSVSCSRLESRQFPVRTDARFDGIAMDRPWWAGEVGQGRRTFKQPRSGLLPPTPKRHLNPLTHLSEQGRRPVRTPKSEQRVYLHRIQLLNTPLPAKYCPAGTMTVEGFISSDSTLKIELLYSFAMKSKALYS